MRGGRKKTKKPVGTAAAAAAGSAAAAAAVIGSGGSTVQYLSLAELRHKHHIMKKTKSSAGATYEMHRQYRAAVNAKQRASPDFATRFTRKTLDTASRAFEHGERVRQLRMLRSSKVIRSKRAARDKRMVEREAAAKAKLDGAIEDADALGADDLVEGGGTNSRRPSDDSGVVNTARSGGGATTPAGGSQRRSFSFKMAAGGIGAIGRRPLSAVSRASVATSPMRPWQEVGQWYKHADGEHWEANVAEWKAKGEAGSGRPDLQPRPQRVRPQSAKLTAEFKQHRRRWQETYVDKDPFGLKSPQRKQLSNMMLPSPFGNYDRTDGEADNVFAWTAKEQEDIAAEEQVAGVGVRLGVTSDDESLVAEDDSSSDDDGTKSARRASGTGHKSPGHSWSPPMKQRWPPESYASMMSHRQPGAWRRRDLQSATVRMPERSGGPHAPNEIETRPGTADATLGRERGDSAADSSRVVVSAQRRRRRTAPSDTPDIRWRPTSAQLMHKSVIEDPDALDRDTEVRAWLMEKSRHAPPSPERNPYPKVSPTKRPSSAAVKYTREDPEDTLALPHYGAGDRIMRAIADRLSEARGIRRVLLRDNRMSDAMVSRCIEALRGASVATLDLSQNTVGRLAVRSFAAFASEANQLQELSLSACHVSDALSVPLLRALSDCHSLRELDVSHNGIAERGGEALAVLIDSANHLARLNAGWNNIRGSGATAVANALAQNVILKQVNLQWNSFGRQGGSALCWALQENKDMEVLHLGHNGLASDTVRGIGVALCFNGMLKRIDLSGNCVGTEGTRAIFRAAVWEGPDSTDVVLSDCNIAPDRSPPYDDIQPNGTFEFRLDDAGDWAAAFELLVECANLPGCSLSSATYFDSPTGAGRGEKLSLEVAETSASSFVTDIACPPSRIITAGGSAAYLPPRVGRLVLSVAHRHALPSIDDCITDEGLAAIIRLVRLPENSGGTDLGVSPTLALLTQGLAGVFLTPAQVMRLVDVFNTHSERVQAAAAALSHVVAPDVDEGASVTERSLLEGVSGSVIGVLARTLLAPSEREDVIRIMGKLFWYLVAPGAPSGHYALNISSTAERILLMRLMARSNTYGDARKAKGLKDVSEHKNWSMFRCEKVNGKSMVLTSEVVCKLCSGIPLAADKAQTRSVARGMVEFDFVSHETPARMLEPSDDGEDATHEEVQEAALEDIRRLVLRAHLFKGWHGGLDTGAPTAAFIVEANAIMRRHKIPLQLREPETKSQPAEDTLSESGNTQGSTDTQPTGADPEKPAAEESEVESAAPEAPESGPDPPTALPGEEAAKHLRKELPDAEWDDMEAELGHGIDLDDLYFGTPTTSLLSLLAMRVGSQACERYLARIRREQVMAAAMRSGAGEEEQRLAGEKLDAATSAATAVADASGANTSDAYVSTGGAAAAGAAAQALVGSGEAENSALAPSRGLGERASSHYNDLMRARLRLVRLAASDVTMSSLQAVLIAMRFPDWIPGLRIEVLIMLSARVCDNALSDMAQLAVSKEEAATLTARMGAIR